MLLIVTNQYDNTAAALAVQWGRADVRIMRPSDLSVGGWSYRPGDVGVSRFVAGGSPARTSDLSGVLTRMACVFEGDLRHIQPADRAYVASEMTALLLAWLSELPVPVINRPTATCLCGPLWSQERWLHMAAGLGIPVVTARRQVRQPGSASPTAPPQGPTPGQKASIRCTMVDGVCLGAPTPQCEKIAVRLAEHAACRLLSVCFQQDDPGHAVAGVDIWPDITNPPVAGALLSALDGRGARVGTGARR
jgi:hypothetical protein